MGCVLNESVLDSCIDILLGFLLKLFFYSLLSFLFGLIGILFLILLEVGIEVLLLE